MIFSLLLNIDFPLLQVQNLIVLLVGVDHQTSQPSPYFICNKITFYVIRSL